MSDREKLIELLDDDAQCDGVLGIDSCDTCPYRYNTHCYTLAIVEHLISNGVTVQKWIPVSKRLPEVRVPVLTYGRKGSIGIGFTQPSSVTADGKVYFYPRYGDNLPTHWMPLPEPPKECE